MVAMLLSHGSRHKLQAALSERSGPVGAFLFLKLVSCLWVRIPTKGRERETGPYGFQTELVAFNHLLAVPFTEVNTVKK